MTKYLPAAAAATTGILVGAAIVATRFVIGQTSPAALAVLGEQAIQPRSSGNQWLGTLAVLASAACGALCSVLYRPYLQKYPTLSVSAFAMLASVLVLAFVAAGEGFFSAPPHFVPAGWLA